ncbi:MAG: hypothetical protein HUJ58_02605 [Erysipelotrichaceae bacterium]|nr:hypothetical protein [Erysipelotrichaceae bacterium]
MTVFTKVHDKFKKEYIAEFELLPDSKVTETKYPNLKLTDKVNLVRILDTDKNPVDGSNLHLLIDGSHSMISGNKLVLKGKKHYQDFLKENFPDGIPNDFPFFENIDDALKDSCDKIMWYLVLRNLYENCLFTEMTSAEVELAERLADNN